MLRGQRLGRRAPSSRQRDRRRETLETVAVIGTGPGERVRGIMRDRQVSHLRMHEPVDRTTADDGAAADARTDGDVDERIDAAPGPPAILGERGAVDVGVEGDGHRQRA